MGIFLLGGEQVSLLLALLCDRHSRQYGDRRERKPLSWAGRGSEERMVCTAVLDAGTLKHSTCSMLLFSCKSDQRDVTHRKGIL